MRVLATALLAGLLAVGADASEIAAGAVVHGDSVFVRSADGVVSAHAVATGARLWSSRDAARPLAAFGRRLVAQAASDAQELRLVFLDTASGRSLGEATVALPEGVSAPLDDSGDTRFRIRIGQDGTQARLDWSFEFVPMRGVLEEDGDDDARQAEGAVVVDLDALRATVTQPQPVAGPQRLPDALARDAEAGAFRERPLRIGPLFVATQAGPAGVILKRWSAEGAALPDVAFPPDMSLQLGSADVRHVLLSRKLPGEPLEREYEWTVVALDTGAPAATLRAPTAAAGFVVAGGRVLAVQQAWEHRTAAGWQRDARRLEAFDRGSGAPAWVQEIRDASYRGPVAP